MSLLVQCPSGHRLQVPDSRVGRPVRCPLCQVAFDVPRPKAEVSKPTAPRPRWKEPNSARPAPPPATTNNDPPEPGSSIGRQPADVDVLKQLADESRTAATEVALLPEIELHLENSTSTRGDQWRRVMRQAESRDGQERRWGLVGLVLAGVGLAVICAIPGLLNQAAARQGDSPGPADVWTYIVLLTALIQAALSVYAVQFPDWSTSWFVSCATTGVAACYAVALALTMFSATEHEMLAALGLADEAFRGTAQRWCIVVMCLALMLAYCQGRFSLRWYHLEQR